MKPQKVYEPLDFQYKNAQQATDHISRPGSINPIKLIRQQPTITPTYQYQQVTYKGTFVNDYLLDNPNLTDKQKKIVKQDKKAFYKTKMCPDGRQCGRKFVCNFAHNENQLRKPFIKRKEVCVLYQRGKCQLGSVCRLYHGNLDLKKKNYKYKTQICKKFLEGKCTDGNICIYIHEYPQKVQMQQGNKQLQQLQVIANDECLQKEAQMKQIEPQDKQQQKIKNSDIKEVIQQKIGTQKFVEDGLEFSFTFNFN